MMKKKNHRFSARADREFRGWHLRFGGLIYSGGARKFLVCVFEDKPSLLNHRGFGIHNHLQELLFVNSITI